MKHGSLFSGVGGFDLAAEWMGWENVFHCEINPFGRKILHYYWPNSISYENIKETDFTPHRGAIDIISGGFPCQPFSNAGKRRGTADDRHLWPEMLRAICEISPRWVVGENVRGLTNWDGGLVFDQVQADLETAGYQTLPLLLPACAVNAPHRRDRIWFIAHALGYDDSGTLPGSNGPAQGLETINGPQYRPAGQLGRTDYRPDEGGKQNQYVITNTENNRLQYSWNTWDGRTGSKDSNCNEFFANTEQPGYKSGLQHETEQHCPHGLPGGADTHTDNQGLQGSENNRSAQSSGPGRTQQPGGFFRPTFDQFPTQSPIRSRNDGLSRELVGITVPSHRNESLKAYGNAVVPQVVYEIFKAIQKYENLKII